MTHNNDNWPSPSQEALDDIKAQKAREDDEKEKAAMADLFTDPPERYVPEPWPAVRDNPEDAAKDAMTTGTGLYFQGKPVDHSMVREVLEKVHGARIGAPGARYQHARYDDLVASTITQIKRLGVEKGGEYAGDDDRLANFRRNAERLGLNMETVWAVYAGKHWDAIGQFIRDKNTGKTRKRAESLGGRVDDLIVYLLLFKCMLDESGDL